MGEGINHPPFETMPQISIIPPQIIDIPELKASESPIFFISLLLNLRKKKLLATAKDTDIAKMK